MVRKIIQNKQVSKLFILIPATGFCFHCRFYANFKLVELECHIIKNRSTIIYYIRSFFFLKKPNLQAKR